MTTPEGPPATIAVSAPAGSSSSGATVAGPATSVVVSAPAGTASGLTLDRNGGLLTMELQQVNVDSQPSTSFVYVFNGPENGTVYFFLDQAATPYVNAKLDAVGSAFVGLPINNLSLGFHDIQVGTTTSLPATTEFNGVQILVTQAPAPTPTPVVVVPPPVRPAGVNLWVFQGFDGVASYTLPRNPERSTRTYGDFVFSAEPTVVSEGRLIEWEGATKPTPWRFTGRVLSQQEHDDMVSWCSRGRVYLTDHHGRRFLVLPALTMTRVRDRERPWHHTYAVTADVLAGDGVPT